MLCTCYKRNDLSDPVSEAFVVRRCCTTNVDGACGLTGVRNKHPQVTIDCAANATSATNNSDSKHTHTPIGVFIIGLRRLSLPKWKCVLKNLLIILCKRKIRTSYITLRESCSLDVANFYKKGKGDWEGRGSG